MNKPNKPVAYSIPRREFLALSGMVPAMAVAQSMGGKVLAAAASSDAAPIAPAPKKRPIGLELYSVRTELARDLPNTLRTVSKIGYEVVEFYAPYYDWTMPYAKEVRSLMDDLGLRCYSTHNHIQSFTPGDTMAKAIELNQIIGSRLLVLATAPGGTKGAEDWKNSPASSPPPSSSSSRTGCPAVSTTTRPSGRRWTASIAPWTSLPPTRRRNSCCNWTLAPVSRPVRIPSPGSRPIRDASRLRTSRTGAGQPCE